MLDDKTAQSKLRTEELFWNMQTGELSSNVYTFLKQPQQEIEGNWFRATMRNGHPTEYHVKQSRGFMPMGDITSGSQAPANGAQQSNDSTPTPQHDAPTSRPKSISTQ